MHIISQGKTSLPIDIAVVEKKYNAKFMGDFCLKTKGGWQGDSCSAIFWQETPPVKGYSNYFALVLLYKPGAEKPTLMITSGESAFDGPITGIVAMNGEVVYSRYRHDFRRSTDGSVTIDGGRDYTRVIGDYAITAEQVYIVANGPDLNIVPIPAEEPKQRVLDILDSDPQGEFKF